MFADLSESDVLCILPGCQAPLHLELGGDLGLGVGTEAWPDGATPESPTFEDMNTRWWKVTCEAGHVVAVPPDDAQDYAEPFSMRRLLHYLAPPDPKEGT